MKRYLSVTDHAIMDYDNQSKPKKREVASEAIAYWVLFLAKEAGGEGIEQARQDWKEKRL